MTRSLATAAALLLTLGACHAKPQPENAIDAIDKQIADGATVADRGGAGLGAAIKVDPARAGDATASGQGGNCLSRFGSTLAFANDWAGKLPEGLPMPPQARLTEAAGHDGGCSIRAISFTMKTTRAAALDWYAGRAAAAGYTADRDDQAGDLRLAGTKGEAAYYVIVGPTAADMVPVDFVWAKPD